MAVSDLVMTKASERFQEYKTCSIFNPFKKLEAGAEESQCNEGGRLLSCLGSLVEG